MKYRSPVLCSVALVAAALLVATPVAASASIVYRAALSGSSVQQWQVHDPSADCVGGGGTQTVQFQAVPNLLVTGSIEDDGGNPYTGGRPWQFEPFKVTGTITRTDTTAVPATPDCDGNPPLPPHDCGGPRSFTIDNAYISKSRGTRRARLHLELSGLNELPDRMFANTPQCYGPELHIDASDGFPARWPGDRRMTSLHRTFTFAGDEPYPPGKQHAVYLPNAQPAALDITTTASWKAQLRSTCHAASSRSLKCG